MKLTILGSGTYQPELDRHSSSYLVETDDGQKICFDFGRGAVDQLLKIGVHINQLDAFFISHWHPDHVSDLLPLLHITIAAPGDLATDWIPRKKPLKLYGPQGTIEKLDLLRKATFLDYFKMEGNIEVREIADDSIDSQDWQVKSFKTVHIPPRIKIDTPALCYRMESNDKVFAYSGDTIESEGLARAIKDADLAIIEASWPEKVKPGSHMTGQRAGKVAEKNGVKKLVLTHMSPLYLKDFDPKKDAKKYFKGEVILAKDLLEFEL